VAPDVNDRGAIILNGWDVQYPNGDHHGKIFRTALVTAPLRSHIWRYCQSRVSGYNSARAYPSWHDRRQTSSETSNVSSLCLAFDQRQAEPGGFFAHRGDLTGTAALVIFLGAQVAKRGAMGEQVVDDTCDFVSRGDNG